VWWHGETVQPYFEEAFRLTELDAVLLVREGESAGSPAAGTMRRSAGSGSRKG
jgi:hypothetical protein